MSGKQARMAAPDSRGLVMCHDAVLLRPHPRRLPPGMAGPQDQQWPIVSTLQCAPGPFAHRSNHQCPTCTHTRRLLPHHSHRSPDHLRFQCHLLPPERELSPTPPPPPRHLGPRPRRPRCRLRAGPRPRRAAPHQQPRRQLGRTTRRRRHAATPDILLVLGAPGSLPPLHAHLDGPRRRRRRARHPRACHVPRAGCCCVRFRDRLWRNCLC
jgi:hypothetical protein